MKRMLVLIAVISVFAFTAQTHAITVVLNGTITESGLPGYINVGDLFEVTITTNDHQIVNREDSNGLRYDGYFYDLISWDWRFLEGSTGSYTGASIGDGFSDSGFSRTRIGVSYLYNDNPLDFIAFQVSDLISHGLGGAEFLSWSVYLGDNKGGSNNRLGRTLIEQSNNYEILRSWENLGDNGTLQFLVYNQGIGLGANGTIDSVVIVPEPCSMLLLGLGGLLLRRRKA